MIMAHSNCIGKSEWDVGRGGGGGGGGVTSNFLHGGGMNVLWNAPLSCCGFKLRMCVKNWHGYGIW